MQIVQRIYINDNFEFVQVMNKNQHSKLAPFNADHDMHVQAKNAGSKVVWSN